MTRIALRNTHVLFSLLVFISACCTASAATMTLADSGKALYTVIVGSDASSTEQYAAQELSDHLKKMTGATFKTTTKAGTKGKRIILGPSKLSRSVLGTKTVGGLGSEEFIIRTVGSDILLVGGRPRGTLYAVYHFLDNILGVRWWTTDATYVPHKPKLVINSLNLRKKPFFEYRGVFTTIGWNPDWAARNRLNDQVMDNPSDASSTLRPPDERHGGGMVYNKEFVHSFDHFIPASKYLATNPEWFSLINGKRVGGQYEGQLCLTNPEVLDRIVEVVREVLRDNPGVRIVSVSQNDSSVGACQCDNCKKIDDEEGSQSGTMIRFVNAVAERIEKQYPDVVIDTLAYQHTQFPPKHARPGRNVAVRLCSIKCSFAQPLTSTELPQNVQFVKDLKGWAAVCQRLYVWDYVANFRNYFRPHPDLRVLGANVRLFASSGVKGVLEQGSYWTTVAEFQELRSWVLSRLTWDPNQNDKALIDEFLKGYYGKGAPYITEYIALLHDRVPSKDYYLTISGDSDPSPVINADSMFKAEEIFRQAENAVQGQPAILNRVRRAHLPVQCMWLMYYNQWSEEAKAKGLNAPDSAQMLAAFRKQLEADKVTLFGEQRPLETQLRVIEDRLSGSSSVTASSSFGSDGPEQAFDGDERTGWVGSSFGPEWIRKDLRKPMKIKGIRTFFGPPYMNDGAVYKIEVSLDGSTWQTLVQERTVNSNKAEDVFSAPVEARYVRTTILSATRPITPKPSWVGMWEQTIESE